MHVACCCANILCHLFTKYRKNEAKRREVGAGRRLFDVAWARLVWRSHPKGLSCICAGVVGGGGGGRVGGLRRPHRRGPVQPGGGELASAAENPRGCRRLQVNNRQREGVCFCAFAPDSKKISSR